MKSLYTVGLLTLLVTIVACKKNDVNPPKKDEVAIIASEAHVFQDGGVQLVAEVLEVPWATLKYGFVLSMDSLFSPYTTQYHYIENKPLSKGIIRFDLHTQLEKNRKYYFSVFTVNDSTQLSTYNVKAFVSTGSKAAKIDSIAPLRAHLKDSLHIYGKYFSSRYFQVMFGDTYAQSNVLNDSVVRVYVPADLQEVKPIIRWQYEDFSATVTNEFALYTPVISSFTPQATFNEMITIFGDHFDTDSTQNIVRIGDFSVPVLSATRQALQVRVPEELTASSNVLTVTAQSQTVQSAEAFKLITPIIESAPLVVTTYEEVTIKARYLHPQYHRNEVFFEGVQAEIISGSATELKVKVPPGPYPRRKATLQVKLMDVSDSHDRDIAIADPWAMVSKGFNTATGYSTPNGVFTIGGVAYALVADHEKIRIYRFNQADYSWRAVNTKTDRPGGLYAATGERIYQYRAFSGQSDYFCAYHPGNNTWETLPPLTTDPAKSSSISALFTVGDEVYLLCRPADFLAGEATFALYAYHTKTKQWTSKSGLPHALFEGFDIGYPITFAIGNNIYLGAGAVMTGSGRFCKYDCIADRWTSVAAGGPIEGKGGSAFVANGKGYVIIGESFNYDYSSRTCFQFDPTSQTWAPLSTPISTNPYEGYGEVSSAFVLGGNAYVFIHNNAGGDDGGLYEIKLDQLR
ncbi:IPT/TIG domain-containing protein [Parapedobacter koreensis]|uniref:IPT/TIG domain-containing protein n=1 Tax=Parapedobacter koreensis TaxID=332977 RepID=A0A1H7SD75_9SPHI|nr:IPT/TIG domain-containing protein [Parapedobacter koreensis]SEL70570.1 IPT/TIG domain-containing protein [Parapedobacter koreensis]